VKRLTFSALLWRLSVIAIILAIAGLASAPPVLGSGPTMAVTMFANGVGAPNSTVSAMSNALYQAIDQTGKFSAAGGGALNVKPAMDGSLTGPAINAASNAGAEQVVIAELISASGDSTVYRLTAYRTAPLAFVRTQIFSQSSLAGNALTASFVSNLNTLYAPRTAVGTIYSTEGGIKADLGASYGFHLGDQFNVTRNGQQMAKAQIVAIDDQDATVTISNATNGYKPQVGDTLVGLQPLSPLNPPHKETNPFTIIGLVVATGVALLAIGQHGTPQQPGQGPQPSPSIIGGFNVICGTQVGQGSPNQTFTFIFSQPVNTSLINFSSPSQIFYTTSVSSSQQPLTALAGTQSFDSTSTILTVTGTVLVPTQQISFNFTSSILSTLGVALTPNTCNYTLSAHRHKAAETRPPLHQEVPGTGGDGIH
jgi:hypothetical protein